MMRPVPTSGSLIATRGARPDLDQTRPPPQDPEVPYLPPGQHLGETR